LESQVTDLKKQVQNDSVSIDTEDNSPSNNKKPVESPSKFKPKKSFREIVFSSEPDVTIDNLYSNVDLLTSKISK